MLSNKVKKAARTSTDFNAERSPVIISAFDWFSKATWPQLREI